MARRCFPVAKIGSSSLPSIDVTYKLDFFFDLLELRVCGLRTLHYCGEFFSFLSRDVVFP